MANSVGTAGSLSTYVRPTTPLSPGNQFGFVSPVHSQQNVVTVTVPTVQQPATVLGLDSSNNSILNAVLGRLPMVVQSLEPGSGIQKNLVAVIDGGGSAALPVLTLSCQGTIAVPPQRQANSQITCSVSQASGLQQSLQPVVVNHIQSQELVAACGVTAKQHLSLSQSQSAVNLINTSPQQTQSLLNPRIMRHTVMVRTLANNSGPTQLNLSVSPASSSQFLMANSTETFPYTKLPHRASSLPEAVVRFNTTTTMQVVQQNSALLATHSASLSEPNVPAKLIAAVPTFDTNISRNIPSGSSINIAPASLALHPSESLTAIIPVTIPCEIQQSDVSAEAAAGHVPIVYSLSTQSPLVAGSAAAAVCQSGLLTSVNFATSLLQMPASTNIVSSSKNLTSLVFSTHATFASYVPAPYVPASVPALPVHYAVPAVTLHRGQQVNSLATGRKRKQQPPRPKITSSACRASSHRTKVNQSKFSQHVIHSSAVGSSPVTVDSLSCSATTHASGTTLAAGVKRKCELGQKYTLLMENGCKYSSVYFDGEGFQAKKPNISSTLAGS